MTKHPITPPPKLVEQWDAECESDNNAEIYSTFDALQQFACKAARWGADQELEACCKWLDNEIGAVDSCDLRAARRPKPPSLAEQKQAILAEIHQLLAQISANNAGALAVAEPIRHALECLQELENNG